MSSYRVLYAQLKSLGVPHALIATVQLVHAGVATVHDLAECIGKSRKQIQRDLASLEGLGVLHVHHGHICLTHMVMDVLNGNGNDHSIHPATNTAVLEVTFPERGSEGEGTNTPASALTAALSPMRTEVSAHPNVSFPHHEQDDEAFKWLLRESWLSLPGVKQNDLLARLRNIPNRTDVDYGTFKTYVQAACDCTRAGVWRGRVTNPLSYAVAMVECMIRERWQPGRDLRTWGSKRIAAIREPSCVA